MEFYRRMPDENILVDCILKWAIDILVIVIIGLFFATYLCNVENVVGNSMTPVMKNDEKVFVNSISYRLFSPDRYDVVMFKLKTKDGDEEKYIKRVIGLPGESIQIKDGKIFVNGKHLKYNINKDKIVNAGIASDTIELGKDEYFVIGDNWNSSEDSRFSSIGCIKSSEMLGKVWMRVAPFIRIGAIGQDNS